jgi:predicted GIY-YIG superfamily endonuclease
MSATSWIARSSGNRSRTPAVSRVKRGCAGMAGYSILGVSPKTPSTAPSRCVSIDRCSMSEDHLRKPIDRTTATDGWWLYVTLCANERLYVGIAKDVHARFELHRSGKGAFYTRLNALVRVLAPQPHPSRSAFEAAFRHQKPGLHSILGTPLASAVTALRQAIAAIRTVPAPSRRTLVRRWYRCNSDAAPRFATSRPTAANT